MKRDNDKYSWRVCIVLILLHFTTAVQANDDGPSAPSFCSDNFIVRFNPFVALEDKSNAYDEEDMVKMVSLIATKFSSVLAPRISVRDANSSLALVATSVAQFNKMHDATLTKPLEVFMAFGDKKNGKVKTGTNLTSFDVVLNVAEKANLVSAGTVRYLLVKPKDFKESNAEDAMNELLTAERKLAGKEEYKLGGLFPLQDCIMGGANGDNVTDHFFPLLDHLKLAIFIQAEDGIGWNEATSLLTAKFEKCQGIITSSKPEMEVGFLTSCPDTDYNGHRNVSNFIHFWKAINNWAMTTNTKVFMLEAFDIPIRSGTDKTKGWWRLTTKGPPEDVYEDKLGNRVRVKSSRNGRALNPPSSSTPNNDTSSLTPEPGDGTNIMTIVLIVVGVSLLSLSLTAGAMQFLWRRVSTKMENESPRGYLSKDELQEFFDGSKASQVDFDVEQAESRRGSVQVLTDNLNSLAYNKEYELTRKSFTIYTGSVLGSGAFGIVCRGKVHLEDEEEIEVAVKMSKPGGEAMGFKGMLAEVKLHSRLGKHPNVVNLIGAYTAELRKRLVYVLTELCEKGSLERYLRSFPITNYVLISSEIQKQMTDDTGDIFGEEPERPGPKQLYKWSYQIVCGMEYLTSRKVVHADLATRNVLLTTDLSAKISDFGLSRRLYDYASYVKSQQAPMPWPWMAPEALRRMEFNEKTDVWAYGITLWEIYSFGDRPYPGLSWTVDLPSRLEGGLRPDKPIYDADEMYKIMLWCWNMEPDKRPTFLALKKGYTLKTK